MEIQIDDSYLHMHESAAHKKLRTLLPPEPVKEFFNIGEFTADFFLENSKAVIKILDNTHDHTDSYHIEKLFADEAGKCGLKAIFIEEGEIFENEQEVSKKLTGV